MQGNIVVAEKSKTVCRMVEISMAKHPFELVYAADGQSALDAVQRHQPVLALIDAALPGIDGYEVARKLKSNGATAGIKVLLMVGRNSRFDSARARQAGIDGHLPKPFLTQKLVESVFQALGQDVPDKGLFRSTTLNIPLARKPAAPEPQVAPPAPPAPRPKPAPRAPAPPAPSAPEPAAPPVDAFAEAPAAPEPPAAPAVPPPDVIQAAVQATTAAVASAAPADALEGASKAVVERIAWEVIPQLAEAILKEEIAKLVRQRLGA